VLLLCAALATSGAGCGGSGSNFKADYQKERPALTRLGTDVLSALQSASGKSNSQIESEFASLSQRSSATLSRLNKLKPDSKSSASFSSLQSSMSKVQQDLGGIAASARASDAKAAKSETQTLVADATTLQDASQQLKSDLGITGQ